MEKRTISRRDFLKFSGIAALTWVTSGCADEFLVEGDSKTTPETGLTKPEILSAKLPVWMPPVMNIYWEMIKQVCSNYDNVDPALVACVMLPESACYPLAMSVDGAIGLMQIMPATAGDIAKRMDTTTDGMYEPAKNIAMGVNHLSWLIRTHGSESMGVCRYYGDCKGQAWAGDRYQERALGMYGDRERDTSVEYERWLSSVINSGGLLLRKAFEYQNMSYDDWVATRNHMPTSTIAATNPAAPSAVDTQPNIQINPSSPCPTVDSSNLPRMIRPGDVIGGVRVEPGDTAYRIWDRLGRPPAIEVCLQQIIVGSGWISRELKKALKLDELVLEDTLTR